MRHWSLLPLLSLLALAAPGAFAQSGAAERVACAGGAADGFPCEQVDLLSFTRVAALGPADTTIAVNDTTSRTYRAELNDIWGWTDPETGREYALVGRTFDVAFVDVTEPTAPVHLGNLPLHPGAFPSLWRDVKVYADHAFVVADNAGNHGMQVFDLTQLRGLTDARRDGAPPVTVEETAHYDGFGSAHNVAINTETGYAYGVGINGLNSCGGGLHMINIQDPSAPTFAGCFADPTTGRRGTGYSHDAQCVVYDGPDEDYQGREICFGANETAISIADVTDKQYPQAIAAATYPLAAYTHQGWLTPDHRYFLVNDELDERGGQVLRTRTIVFDVTDLDDPVLATEYLGPVASIDHNLYTRGAYAFLANYTSGLRILDIADPTNPREVAFFDTYPSGDPLAFDGAWSVYPYFESGTVIISSIGQGLFVVDPMGITLPSATAAEEGAVPETFTLSAAYPNPFNPQTRFTLDVQAAQAVTVAVYDALGRRVRLVHDGALAAGTHAFTLDAGSLPSGTYLIRASGSDQTTATPVVLVK